MHEYALAHSRVEVRSATGYQEVLMLLDGGQRFEAWENYRDEHSLGIEAQRAKARSVGLLVDFAGARGAEFYSPDSRTQFFVRFAEALALGTVSEGDDPSNLWWMPRSLASVERTLSETSDFTSWLSQRQGKTPLNPMRTASSAERLVFWARWSRLKGTSLLRHVKSGRRAQADAQRTRSVRSKRRAPRAAGNVKAFPEESFPALLRDGFRRSSSVAWTTLRDQMIAVLLHGGGVRVSEPLQMWVGDVYEDPSDKTIAHVRIFHPYDGVVEVLDENGARPVRLTRAKLLRTKYNRLPLPEMPRSERVGWKNPLLNDQNDRFMIVFWRAPEYGRLFLELYKRYMLCRPRVTNHPYLFVSSSLRPMTVKGFEKVHAAAVRRIGLSPGKHLGTTPHGHRHAFGNALAEAELSEKVIQLALHHGSVNSQAVYKTVDLGAVRDLLLRCSAVPLSLLERS